MAFAHYLGNPPKVENNIWRMPYYNTEKKLILACKYKQLDIARDIISEHERLISIMLRSRENINEMVARHGCKILTDKCWMRVLQSAYEGGDTSIIEYISSKCQHPEYAKYNAQLLGACAGGHTDLLLQALEYSSRNLDRAMYTACLNNHRHIIHILLQHSTCGSYLEGACRGGHLELAREMLPIFLACDYPPDVMLHRLNTCLCDACYSGNEAIVQMLISAGANDYSRCTYSACSGGHPDIVKLLLPHVHMPRIIDECFHAGCKSGNPDIIALFPTANAYYISCLDACESGNIQCVKMILEKLSDRHKTLFARKGIYHALKSRNAALIDFLASYGTEWMLCKWDFSYNVEVFELILPPEVQDEYIHDYYYYLETYVMDRIANRDYSALYGLFN